MYEQGLNLVGDHILKDGTRVGSKLLHAFTRGFVDALYAKIFLLLKWLIQKVRQLSESEGGMLMRQ